MGIQNIDFAKSIDIKEKKNRFHKNNTNKNKFSWYLMIFFFGFTFGFYFGYQFFKLKHLEENLIKNPDTLELTEELQKANVNKSESNMTIYSNIPAEKGDYIVFLGRFEAKKSSEILKYLENKNVFEPHKFYPCINLNSFNISKNHDGIYRIPVENGKYHKLLIGCFKEKSRAEAFLMQLIQFNKELFKNSEIFQIQEQN